MNPNHEKALKSLVALLVPNVDDLIGPDTLRDVFQRIGYAAAEDPEIMKAFQNLVRESK